jgi:hypothetical protein
MLGSKRESAQLRLMSASTAADISSRRPKQSLANQQRISDHRALAVFDKHVIKGLDRKPLQGSVPLDRKNFQGSKAIGRVRIPPYIVPGSG